MHFSSKHEGSRTGRSGFGHVCAFHIIYVPLNEHEHQQQDVSDVLKSGRI